MSLHGHTFDFEDTVINDPPIKGRECGNCNVCCILPRITELNKAENIACQHLRSDLPVLGQCSIYNERPASCSGFQCLWLQGHIGGEAHRPDKFGIMWTISKGDVYQAWEVFEGSANTEKVRYMLNKIAQSWVFIFRRIGQSNSLMGRARDVARFLKDRNLDGSGRPK